MKDLLIATAMKLTQVSDLAANEYVGKSDLLISMINSRMLERSDIEDIVSENNLSMMKDNHANHVRFISSILKNRNPEVLVETILWVFRAYRSHHFTTNYWAAQLNCWIEILREVLTLDSYNEIYPYYEWMQINIPIFVIVSDEKLDAQNSMH